VRSASPRRRILALAFLGAAALVSAGAGAVERPTPAQAGPVPAAFDPEKTYPVDALREDLAVLWDVLEEGHGGFDRYTPFSALRRSFDAVRAGLAGPLTEFEFFTRLAPLIAEIKDGHTRLMLSSGATAHLDSRPVHFPLGLRFIGAKAYVLRNLCPDAGIEDGAELLAIDGTASADILKVLLPLVSSDAGIRTAKLRRLEDLASFGSLLALRYGPRESFRVRLRPPRGGEVRETTLPGITAGDIPRLLTERYPAAVERRPTYELSFRGPAALLRIRSFSDDPDKERPRYPDFVEAAFRTLDEKKTPGLVIDLRGNGGGHDEYAKLVFAHVMDRPFLY